VHFWPADQKAPAYAASTAASSFASARTISGLWPPSSSWTRLPSFVASSRTDWPTGTEPVNEIARTRGSRTIALPTFEPEPVSTFSTPAGSPASARHSARRSPVTGASVASFSTTALP
jgi:hypothetical protein